MIGFFLFLLLQHRANTFRGQIEGSISSRSGKPVKSVLVFETRLDTGQDPHAAAETDKDGHFVIGNLPSGRYRIYAKDDALGIPDQSFLVFRTDDTKYPEIEIDQTRPGNVGTIVLPATFGILVVHVYDANKTALPLSEVTLRLSDDPTVFYSTTTDSKGELTLRLPRRKFLLEVQPRRLVGGVPTAKQNFALDGIDSEKREDLVVVSK